MSDVRGRDDMRESLRAGLRQMLDRVRAAAEDNRHTRSAATGASRRNVAVASNVGRRGRSTAAYSVQVGDETRSGVLWDTDGAVDRTAEERPPAD